MRESVIATRVLRGRALSRGHHLPHLREHAKTARAPARALSMAHVTQQTAPERKVIEMKVRELIAVLEDLDPEAAPVVRRIFSEFIAGHGFYAIAEGLTRDGIPCPSAHDPARNRHRCGIAWNKFAVRAILVNASRRHWRRAAGAATAAIAVIGRHFDRSFPNSDTCYQQTKRGIHSRHMLP